MHDDGQENLFNKKGIKVKLVEIEMDEEVFPINTVTNFGMYFDLKPPEKPAKKTIGQSEAADVKIEEDIRNREAYKSYKDLEKQQLFCLVYERGMSAREAGLKLQINIRTTQRWATNDQQEPQMYTERKEGSGRPKGWPPKLDYCHKKLVIDLVNDQFSLVLDQTMENSTVSFIDLEISKTALYNIVTGNCKISSKRVHFILLFKAALKKSRHERNG